MFHVKHHVPKMTISTLIKFHVKHILNIIKSLKIHEILFFVFIFLIPIQLRILYYPDLAYTSWYFNYHEAIFVYLTDLVLVACFTTWLLHDFPRNMHKRPEFGLIAGFFGIIVLGLFPVKHFELGIYETLKWTELLILVVYIRETFNIRLKYLYTAVILFVAGVIQSIIAIFQFHVQHGLGLSWLGEYIAPLGTAGLANVSHETEKVIRAYGTMPHPNVLGGFLIVCLILGIYLLAVKENQPEKRPVVSRETLISIGLGIIIFGIFVSLSRTAWIATAVVLIGFTIHFWLTNQKRSIATLILIAIVSCTTIGIYGHEYFVSRTTNIDSPSISGRADYNQMAIEIVKQNPVLGTGAGDYINFLKETFELEPWQYQPAHNIFIVITAQFGILALVLFVKLLSIYFRKVMKQNRETLIFTFILAGATVILVGQADHYFVTIQQGRLIFFTVLGLLAALPNLQQPHES